MYTIFDELNEEERDDLLWEIEQRRRESVVPWPFQRVLGFLDGEDALDLEKKTNLQAVVNSKTMSMYYGKPTVGYGSLEFDNMELLSSAVNWVEMNWTPGKTFTSREDIAANLITLFGSRSVS